jgi:hypothetical protein
LVCRSRGLSLQCLHSAGGTKRLLDTLRPKLCSLPAKTAKLGSKGLCCARNGGLLPYELLRELL